MGKFKVVTENNDIHNFESKIQLAGTLEQALNPNKREFTQACVGILSKSQTKNVNIALVFEDAARLESTAAPLQDQSYIYQVL